MQELSLNVLDIAQNSIAAQAQTIQVTITRDTRQSLLTISIEDDGCGMSEEQLQRVTDPFFTTRTTRKVGMGIPLFKMQSELCGGSFELQSEVGKGTVIRASFRTDHIDFIPLGDISSTMATLICLNQDRGFVYRYAVDDREVVIRTADFLEALGEDVPLNAPEIMGWIEEYIREQTQALDAPPAG